MMKYFRLITASIIVTVASVGLISCDGCSSKLEEFGSKAELFNSDLDGDGDYGDRSGEYNPSFGAKSQHSCNKCSCDEYEGTKHLNGTYEGDCTNTDTNGNTCNHSPEHHGLKSY